MKKLDELKELVISKKADLEAQLEELEANANKNKGAIEELKFKLNQLHTYLKDGWERVDEERATLLEDWLEQ